MCVCVQVCVCETPCVLRCVCACVPTLARIPGGSRWQANMPATQTRTHLKSQPGVKALYPGGVCCQVTDLLDSVVFQDPQLPL